MQQGKSQKASIIIGITFSLGASAVMLHQMMGTSAMSTDQTLRPLRTNTAWSKDTGQYLQYGMYDNEPVQYRILEYEGDKILLDCDVGLYVTPYNSADTRANEWGESQLYMSLNGDEFLTKEGVFTPVEKASILQTDIEHNESYKIKRRDGTSLTYRDTSGTSKIFALSGTQSQDLYDGEKDRAKESTANYWWLRSRGEPTDKQGEYTVSIDIYGIENYIEVSQHTVSVSPAMYIEDKQIAYIWPASQRRSDLTVVDLSQSQDKVWQLSLRGGKDFKAKRTITDKDWSQGGDIISIQVQGMGTTDEQISYSQISAIIYDQDNTIRAYGKVGEISDTKLDIQIPEGLANESLIVAVFLEDIQTPTSYASNMVTVDIGQQGEVPEIEEEVPEVEQEDLPQTEPEPETPVPSTPAPTPNQYTSTVPSVTYPSITRVPTQEKEQIISSFLTVSGGGVLASGKEATEEVYNALTSILGLAQYTETSWWKDMWTMDKEVHETWEENTTSESMGDTSQTMPSELINARMRFVGSMGLLMAQQLYGATRKAKQLKKSKDNLEELRKIQI